MELVDHPREKPTEDASAGTVCLIAGKGHNLSVRMGSETIHHSLDMPRKHVVVAVEVHHEFGSGGGEAGIACGGCSRAALVEHPHRHSGHAGLLHYPVEALPGPIGRTVVDGHNLNPPGAPA